MKKVLVALIVLVAIASLAGNLFLYQRYSSSRPVMQIGGETVTVKEFRDSLEYQYGAPVLTKLAMAKLVMSAARKAGVAPTEKDVDNKLAEIERRYPQVLEAAHRDPAKMADFRRDLMADIALENLRIKDVKLTASQVRAFYNQNKQMFQVPTQAQTLMIVASNSVDAATAEQLSKMKQMTPATIASTQPRLRVVGVNGFNPDWNTISTTVRKRLSDAVLATPQGGVVTVRAKEGKEEMFFVVRVDKRANAQLIPFDKARPNAERLARLARAPKQEVAIARLYKEANVQFEIPRYESYFQQIAEAAKRTPAAASSSTK